MSKFPEVMMKPAMIAACFALVGAPVMAEPFGLGRAATEDEVAAWDTDVRPDGLGLPVGSGDALTGEEVFAEKCAVCHGDFGEGVGRWPVLAGGQGSLTSERPVKTIGSYWPYASTAYDYIYRAMPFGDAKSLSPDEVYAITAYLLYMNDVIEDDFELNQDNLAQIELPNATQFFDDDRLETEKFASADICMTDCKDSVEITMRAAVLDVTPEDEGGADAKPEEGTPAVVAATEDAPAKAEPEPVAEPEPEVAALDPELVAAGEKVFRKCKACHQIGDGAKNRTGPILTGIVGSPAGQVEGFKYSNQLLEAGLTWDEDTLAAFLTKPRDVIKGTKMSFAGLRKEKDIAAVIAYLKSASE